MKSAPLLLFAALPALVHAQDAPPDTVVVTASRAEQRRFDVPAAIDAVQVDTLRAGSPLVNLSELLGQVPGLQARERQNYAQDLQISVRGFGARATFGVRGVRLLVDGIPATMPDGQGQASTAALSAARRIEVLRGPLAQLYGNAAGGVVQVITQDPPRGGPVFGGTLGAGSDGQRQAGVSLAGGNETLGALVDVSRFETDGYRVHSAARRTQLHAKAVARFAPGTTLTLLYGDFDQPLSQDPAGLTHALFERDPRTVVPEVLAFDTRKTIAQRQGGAVLSHALSERDTLTARLYYGTRQVFQTLAFSGAAATSSGGVVDLDRDYGGAALSWMRDAQLAGRPLRWTVGFDADNLRELRRGYVNDNGRPGALRRDELDRARNRDVYAQADWRVTEDWRVLAGVRDSRVRLSVDDRYRTAASPDDSGSVYFHQASPVVGAVWHVSDDLNVYANAGRGFETPTLAESAYRAGGTGPNFALRPSVSTQLETGIKLRRGAHTLDAALFHARSDGEITPQGSSGGRTIYQNVDGVVRRGLEASWQGRWPALTAQVAYTLLDARFREGFTNGAGAVPAGRRLPGAPRNSLSASLEVRALPRLTAALEARTESRAWVDDTNTDAAPGYAVAHLRAGYALREGDMPVYLFARIDNLFDRRYAGSVIVNDGNGRYFEPAPGRRMFAGIRMQIR